MHRSYRSVVAVTLAFLAGLVRAQPSPIVGDVGFVFAEFTPGALRQLDVEVTAQGFNPGIFVFNGSGGITSSGLSRTFSGMVPPDTYYVAVVETPSVISIGTPWVVNTSTSSATGQYTLTINGTTLQRTLQPNVVEWTLLRLPNIDAIDLNAGVFAFNGARIDVQSSGDGDASLPFRLGALESFAVWDRNTGELLAARRGTVFSSFGFDIGFEISANLPEGDYLFGASSRDTMWFKNFGFFTAGAPFTPREDQNLSLNGRFASVDYDGLEVEWMIGSVGPDPALSCQPGVFCNPGFDDPSGTAAGWTIEDATGLLVRDAAETGDVSGTYPDGFFAAMGAFAEAPETRISQTLETIPGASYLVRYDFGSFGFPSPTDPVSLEVRVTDAVSSGELAVSIETDSTPVSVIGDLFQTFELFFVATSASTKFTFRDVSPPPAVRSDALLDNVELVPVAICPADIAAPFGVDSVDLLAALDGFAASESFADFDGNGVLNVFDLIRYLELLATCP